MASACDIPDVFNLAAAHNLLLLARNMGLHIPHENTINQLEFDMLLMKDNQPLSKEAQEIYENMVYDIHNQMAAYVDESLEENSGKITRMPKRSHTVAFSEQKVIKRRQNNESCRESRRRKVEQRMIAQYETKYLERVNEDVLNQIEDINDEIKEREHELAKLIHPDEVLRLRAIYGLEGVNTKNREENNNEKF